MNRQLSQLKMHHQSGSVLMISLIMLIVLTLLAVSSINMSSAGLRIVNAMQMRGEASSAAQRVVEGFINTNFSANLGTIAGSYTVAVDAGKSYDVTVSTPCLKQMVAIRNTELNLSDTEEKKCYDTSTNPFSACAQTIWEFRSSVSDSFFGTGATVIQGVSLRMDNSSAIAYQASTSPVYVCP